MEPQQRDPVLDLAERLAQMEPRLDELTRQRVLVRIHEQLESEASRQSASSSRQKTWLSAAALLGVALVLALFLTHKPASPSVARPISTLSVATAALSPAPLLAPYLVAGTEPERAAQLLDSRLNELELAAGERMLAALSDSARIGIVGPARLSLRELSPGQLDLVLSQGTLLGDYDHLHGGRLTIHAPGMTVEIVGTLFLVHADPQTSRVAVAHGTVRVLRDGTETTVRGSQVLQSSGKVPGAISDADATVLYDHARIPTAPVGDQGVLGIAGQRLHAEVADQLLGDTPLWVKLPAGAHTITLRAAGDAIGSGQELRTEVSAKRRTELVVAAPLEPKGANPARLVRPSQPHAPRRSDAPPAPRSAADLYREAESAMRAADLDGASDRLTQLVRTHPDAASVDLALYELAELALRRADHGSAARWLAQLEAHGARAALLEPFHFLRCHNLQQRESSAPYAACLEQFQAQFPGSPHAAEVLGSLAAWRFERDGCSAKGLLNDYLRRYPHGVFAEDFMIKRRSCER